MAAIDSSSTNPAPVPARSSLLRAGGISKARLGDGIFYWSTFVFAAVVLVLTLWLGIQLFLAARPAISRFGLGFLTSSIWNPVDDDSVKNANVFGAWPYIYGTLVSSAIALILAVPVGVGTAIYLAELAPKKLRTPLSFMVELLAAVPSVVYGLWGRLVMLPALAAVMTVFYDELHDKPVIGVFFSTEPSSAGFMLAGGLILAIMVLPFITAISREVIKAVPPIQREAAFGLGATHWEAVKGPILRAARSGIIGAIILALARALGETMAITMVCGDSNQANLSLLAPANTLASQLALQFGEAQNMQYNALMYLALILFGITIVVNSIARLMIWNMARGIQGSVRG